MEHGPILELARQTAASHYPLTAEWAAPDAFRSDNADAPIPPGIETSLQLEFNGAVESACGLGFAPVDPSGRSANALTTSAQISTSDWRIQGTIPGDLGVHVDANGVVSYYSFSASTVFRSAELETTFGIHGVDLFGSDCGVLFLDLRFDAVRNQKWGSLEVDSRPCDDTSFEPIRLGDFLSWCSGPCEYPATPFISR